MMMMMMMMMMIMMMMIMTMIKLIILLLIIIKYYSFIDYWLMVAQYGMDVIIAQLEGSEWWHPIALAVAHASRQWGVFNT